jgi:hypothetical protein
MTLFSYTAQNTAAWTSNNNGGSYSFGGTTGYMSITGNTTSNNYQTINSYQYFRTWNTAGGIAFKTRLVFLIAPEVNNNMYWGLGQLSLSPPAEPADGVYFRTIGTAMTGVLNYNGTLNTVSISTPSTNALHEYLIYLYEGKAEFWIDGVLQGTVTAPNNQPASTFFQAGSIFYQNWNSGGAPASAQKINVNSAHIWQLDADVNVSWPHQMCKMGLMGYQGNPTQTQGTTAQYANSANPSAAVPTNTGASLGTGLGGNFWSTNSIAVNTDGIISSYQNPAANAVAVQGRSLVITGVRIDSTVQTILAGGPEILCWSLAFGHTSVSLATGEAASAKAPRRIALGIQNFAVTAAVGTQPQIIDVKFQCPVVIHPSQFVQTVYKNIGTVGTSGTIAHLITFDCHWE